MRINEEKVQAGYDAWDQARKSNEQHVVYGVVYDAKGDTVYSWAPSGALERIVNYGFCTALCHASDDDKIAKAMSEDRFSVVLGEHRKKDRLLRIYPGLSDNCSKKSAHPSIGGLGMTPAVLLGP